MSIIFHKSATDRIKELEQKFASIGMSDQFDHMLSLLMKYILRWEVIDGGEEVTDVASRDFYLFAESHDSTDFFWTITRHGINHREIVGGFNCHTKWFREYMAKTKTMAQVFMMAREDNFDREVKWSVNT